MHTRTHACTHAVRVKQTLNVMPGYTFPTYKMLRTGIKESLHHTHTFILASQRKKYLAIWRSLHFYHALISPTPLYSIG